MPVLTSVMSVSPQPPPCHSPVVLTVCPTGTTDPVWWGSGFHSYPTWRLSWYGRWICVVMSHSSLTTWFVSNNYRVYKGGNFTQLPQCVSCLFRNRSNWNSFVPSVTIEIRQWCSPPPFYSCDSLTFLSCVWVAVSDQTFDSSVCRWWCPECVFPTPFLICLVWVPLSRSNVKSWTGLLTQLFVLLGCEWRCLSKCFYVLQLHWVLFLWAPVSFFILFDCEFACECFLQVCLGKACRCEGEKRRQRNVRAACELSPGPCSHFLSDWKQTFLLFGEEVTQPLSPTLTFSWPITWPNRMIFLTPTVHH